MATSALPPSTLGATVCLSLVSYPHPSPKDLLLAFTGGQNHERTLFSPHIVNRKKLRVLEPKRLGWVQILSLSLVEPRK